ncbi:hypothetical protein PoB_006263400 [Plakobranchus ocellatus]|uniref:Uncharacterized protein n=1 Tax=Plakobranchus ocellatus TaxID=259542 RepID=A0AAV4CW63_9GAST|nr:hypothetical protein PoB_006263400 [Plakobranchus ocellatus]
MSSCDKQMNYNRTKSVKELCDYGLEANCQGFYFLLVLVCPALIHPRNARTSKVTVQGLGSYLADPRFVEAGPTGGNQAEKYRASGLPLIVVELSTFP